MLQGTSIRRLYQSFESGGSNYLGQTGWRGFVGNMRNLLGLDTDEFNRPRVVNPTIHPTEVSIKELAESLCGYEWVKGLEPGMGRGGLYQAFEATGGADNASVSPGDLPNVSAFLGSVIGLLESRLLSAYQTPEFQADKIFYTTPSKTRTTKLIGTGRIGDRASRRNPGDAFPRANFQERYVLTPETQNDALAIDVTFEAVFYDQTSEVLERARSIGMELGLRKELNCMAVLCGIPNMTTPVLANPYAYRGIAYNTYQTASPWINVKSSNGLTDWTNVNAVRALFSRMTDQETGNRVAITPNTLIVSPVKEETAKYIMRATEVELLAAGTAATPATDLAGSTRFRGANSESSRYNLIVSPYLDQILTAASTATAPGLGLTQAQADGTWFMGQFGSEDGAFVYMENWGLQVETASPDSYTMRDHKLLLSMFADQMGVPTVKEPRKVIGCSAGTFQSS